MDSILTSISELLDGLQQDLTYVDETLLDAISKLSSSQGLDEAERARLVVAMTRAHKLLKKMYW